MRSQAKASFAASTMGGAPSKWPLRLASAALGALLIVLAIAPTASAVLTRPRTATIGPGGTTGGPFISGKATTTSGGPKSLAFDQSDGSLYVLEKNEVLGNGKMFAFDAPSMAPIAGNFPLAVGNISGAPDLAAGPAGDIFFASSSAGLSRFDSTGFELGGKFPIDPTINPGPPFSSTQYLCEVALDSADNIWVSNSFVSSSFFSGRLLKYDSTGTFQSTFDLSAQHPGEPCGIAFDSNDDMFVVFNPVFTSETYTGTAVWKYTAPAYTTATPVVTPVTVDIQNLPTPFEPDPAARAKDVAVDPGAHRLYVVYENRVAVYDCVTNDFLYEFAGGIPDEDLEDVAIEQATDRVYVSDRRNGRVYAFGPAQSFPNATAELNPAKNLTDVSANLSAGIDDNGALNTTWRIEVSSDGGVNWTTVSSGLTNGGETDATVSGAATDLLPNTSYGFRIVTNKGPGSDNVPSPTFFFKTVAPPPVLSDIGPVGVSDTSARLAGTIDPRNTATAYVFEYGTTPALGSSTAPVSIGSGTKPITISRVASGLSPSTVYYFKLVATNLSGATASTSQTFTTRAQPQPLPADRGYEMVTPPDKNLGSADVITLFPNPQAGVSRSGQSIAFCTLANIGEPPPPTNTVCSSYLSRRTADGWQTQQLAPPYCGNRAAPPLIMLSPELDHAVVEVSESAECLVPPLDPAAPLPTRNLYRQDMTSDPFTYDLLTPEVEGPAPGPGVEVRAIYEGGNDDFSHIFYVSRANQTSPPDSPPPAVFPKVYEWVNGSLRLVSRDVNNQPFETASNVASIYHDSNNFEVAADAVSQDGDRVYFQNQVTTARPGGCSTTACDLYMRENGAITYKVSESECTVACGSADGPDAFKWASPSGDMALFVSCAKLTNSAAPPACFGIGGEKLYRWDRTAPPGHRLTEVSIDNEPAPESSIPDSGLQPNFEELIGASDDGNVAFFIATGQLVAGEPRNNRPKLYRWTWNEGDPQVDFLASLTRGQVHENSDESSWGNARIRVTPSGHYLVIGSFERLSPAVDRDEDRDVYRWSEADGWLCISCQLPGVASAGDSAAGDSFFVTESSLFRGLESNSLEAAERMPVISDDGQRIFFDSPDALVPADVNGEVSCPFASRPRFVRTCNDVYEWHDGTVSLVSAGTGSEPSYLIGMSHSGDDVFFFTHDRLVGWDTDNGTDIYDARVGGGFPEPPPAPPSCEGEACRQGGSATPVGSGAGTAVFEGPGNPTPKRRSAGKRHKKKHSHQHRKNHKRAANHNRRAGR